jgi:tetratricopeptide (TPR) repeat protein
MSDMGGNGATAAELQTRYQHCRQLYAAKEFAAAELELHAVVSAARQAGLMQQVAQALFGLALIAINRGEFLLSEQYVTETLSIGEALGLHDQLAQGYYARAAAQMVLGRLAEADATLESALMYANLAGDKFRQAAIQNDQGRLCFWLGRFEDAYHYHLSAAELFGDFPEQERWPVPLIEASQAAFELCWEEAERAAYDRAAALEGCVGYARIMADAANTNVANCILLGNLAAAERFMTIAEAGSGGDNLTQQEVFSLELTRARFQRASGNRDAALAHFAQAKRLAQQLHSRCSLAEARLEQAEALIEFGQLDEAMCELLDAQLAFEKFGAKSYLAQTHCAWAQCYVAEGRVDAAAAAVQEATNIAKALEPHPGRTLSAALASAQAAVARTSSA